MNKLPKELAETAEQKWQAFCSPMEAAGMDPSSFDAIGPELRRVFALSDFVASSCIRKPRLAFDLLKNGALEQSYPPGAYLVKLRDRLGDIADEDAVSRVLRILRGEEMVRIAWRDISGRATLAETTAELSAFADACIQAALGVAYRFFRLVCTCATTGYFQTGSQSRPLHRFWSALDTGRPDHR